MVNLHELSMAIFNSDGCLPEGFYVPMCHITFNWRGDKYHPISSPDIFPWNGDVFPLDPQRVRTYTHPCEKVWQTSPAFEVVETYLAYLVWLNRWVLDDLDGVSPKGNILEGHSFRQIQDLELGRCIQIPYHHCTPILNPTNPPWNPIFDA